jgi:hypothetical protein
MKKAILSIGICLFSITAFSQTSNTDAARPSQAAPERMHRQKQMQSVEKRAKEYTNELKNVLNLTDDQYSKIMAVNTECIKRKDAVRQSGGDNASGFKEIAQYRRQQFQTILTPTQMQQLKNYQMTQSDNRARAPQGGNQPNGNNGE